MFIDQALAERKRALAALRELRALKRSARLVPDCARRRSRQESALIDFVYRE